MCFPRAAWCLSWVLLLCCGTAVGAPTTGVYDENAGQANGVDLLAAGSSVSIAQFSADVAAAHAQDFGGVMDGSAAVSSYTYGVNQSKTLLVNGIQADSIVGSPAPSPLPISGTQAFSFNAISSSRRSWGNKFAGIVNGLSNEQVVEMGVTVLSSGLDYGTVTFNGLLNNGTHMNIVSTINHETGTGDTLFNLVAPPGRWFVANGISYTGTIGANDRLWFDDLAFVTAVIPEPSGLVLGLVGGAIAVEVAARRSSCVALDARRRRGAH
ncbi:MAG: hypothetical protein AB7O59_01210 [Pirellulales bacterium]